MIIRAAAYPRAGLIGNPSDGYFGRTISFCFREFIAEVVLYESPELEILPNTRDNSVFASIEDLAKDVSRFGYYGGVRLLKAAIKKFYDYCRENGIRLDRRNFTVRYHSTIPHHVGLAGSSAIITACVRALMSFYGVEIPKPIKANLILSVETEELDISAGLQDRVAQVYQGLTYMNFDKELTTRQGWGDYIPMDPKLLPPLYIAYREDLSEGSEVFHNNIRSRFEMGDKEIIAAMAYWADLTDRVRALLEEGKKDEIGPLLDANFNKRREIYKISKGNLEMVAAARSVGASAKFTGSGGAIVGAYADEAMFQALKKRLEAANVKVIKPTIV